MIKLKFKCETKKIHAPFVGKIRVCEALRDKTNTPKDGELLAMYDEQMVGYSCHSTEGDAFISCEPQYELDGDVFLLIPERKEAQRLIRRKSNHNTILFTEQCDQLCMMCSQPPRAINDKWLFPFYEKAICLADQGATIGISGGEPTIHKVELFSLLENISIKRPDLSFHILTNAQHFNLEDRSRLQGIQQSLNLLWGIPLYSSSAKEHDEIVQKPGAYNLLNKNLFFLASCGGAIELRTVLIKKNILELPHLAKFIAKNLNFIAFWAIMNLEQIGYAKLFKEELFFDYSQFFVPVANAIEITKSYNIPVSLYNFPLCTVPVEYRDYCTDSISDWKKKFIPTCKPCTKKNSCAGFFEWYTPDWELTGIHPLS